MLREASEGLSLALKQIMGRQGQPILLVVMAARRTSVSSSKPIWGKRFSA